MTQDSDLSSTQLEQLANALSLLGVSQIDELVIFDRSDLESLLVEYGIAPLIANYILQYRDRSAALSEAMKQPPDCKEPTPPHAAPATASIALPMALGTLEKHDRFGTTFCSPAELPFDEDGLRRHLQIIGSSGSGKTVAARFIIEQAAVAGVPSIVVDCQGDLSSLVLLPHSLRKEDFLATIPAIAFGASGDDERRSDIEKKVESHFKSLRESGIDDSCLAAFASSVLPRIFTPKRSSLGLALSLPPFSAAAFTAEVSREADIERQELLDHYNEELQTLVSLLVPRASDEKKRDYQELLRKLLDHARINSVNISGANGIDALLQIVAKSPDLAPDLFVHNLSEGDLKNLQAAVNRLTFAVEQPWLEGHPFDIGKMISRVRNRTPINVLNIHNLSPSDQHRMLRAVVGAVYRYAVQNPKPAGIPSLILFIDEIGTGYGGQAVAKPSANDNYHVYRALSRLVAQARKYGVSVILASQVNTHFDPSIRQNLSTKIVGRIAEAAEQRRVIDTLAQEARIGGISAESFVRAQLPTLSPPRLILQNPKGRTDVYHQNKCFSLDIAMRDNDIYAWRASYTTALTNLVNDIAKSHVTASDAGSLSALQDLRDEYYWTGNATTPIDVLIIRALLAARDYDNAHAALRGMPVLSLPASILDFLLSLTQSCATPAQKPNLMALVDTALEKWDGAPPDLAAAEQLRVALLRHTVLSGDSPRTAIFRFADALSASPTRRASTFARLWKSVADAFCDWRAAWSCATAGNATAVRLYHLGPNARCESHTVTTDDTTDTSPITITSDLVTKSENFSLSARLQYCIADSHAESLNHTAFQDCYEHIAVALRTASQRLAIGNIDGAVEAIDGLDRRTLRVAARLACPDLQQLLATDARPIIRARRVRLWIESMDWRRFEQETANLFIAMGYRTLLCSGTNDDGVDVYGARGDERVVIQCKHWRNAVGKTVVQAIRAKATEDNATHAVLVTSGRVEPGAAAWARNNDVDIIDGDRLVELMLEYVASSAGCTNANGSCAAPERSPSPPLTAPARPALPATPVSMPRPTLFGHDHDLSNRIRELVRTRGSVANADVRELLGVSSPVSSELLRKACEDGWLIMVGIKRGARYHLKEVTTGTHTAPASNSAFGTTTAAPAAAVRTSGIIEFYDCRKRFGKIRADDSGTDLFFFHVNHLESALDEVLLCEHVVVTFDCVNTPRGLQAHSVRVELSPEQRRAATIGRRGAIADRFAYHAFCIDEKSGLSLYVPHTAMPPDVWRDLRSGMIVSCTIVPSTNAKHPGRWEVASLELAV